MIKNIKRLIDNIWEIPMFYRILQATLAGGGHNIIKKYLLSQVPKSARKILDQGCGTGEYSLLFKNKYWGIDNNLDDINFAKEKYLGHFEVGNASRISFKDNFFDAVFAVGLHHHLDTKNAKKAITESLRVTRKDGKVIIIDAMLPKNPLNFLGFILRKLDRGGFVRDYKKTLSFIPKKIEFNSQVLSSYPFDYIAIIIKK